MAKRWVRQYLVKLRGFSYARSEWLSAAQIEADGKLSRNCLQRFLRKHVEGEEPIDKSYQEYLTLDRIIGHRMRRSAVGGEARAGEGAAAAIEFLCKWNGQSYADCSWEAEGGAVTADHVDAYKGLSNLEDSERKRAEAEEADARSTAGSASRRWWR